MHLPLDVFWKDQEEIWALITREQSFRAQSPNARTYKIDDSTPKNKEGWQECLDVLRKVRFVKSEKKMAK